MKKKRVIQHEDQYYVLATSPLTDERLQILKTGETFALFNCLGDIGPFSGKESGVYHNDTRHLSLSDLVIGDDDKPLLLNSYSKDGVLTIDLMNPDMVDGSGHLALAKGALHMRRQILLERGLMKEQLTLQNFSTEPIHIQVTLRWDADFRDIFEVRGAVRAKRGQIQTPGHDQKGVNLIYRGLDDVERTTKIRFCPEPRTTSPTGVNWLAALQPYGHISLFVDFAFQAQDRAMDFRQVHEQLRARSASFEALFAHVSSGHDQFNLWLDRSVSDLNMLMGEVQQQPYPFAGVPWFSTPFGRDGIITAMQTLWINPEIARGVLTFLTATQANEVDPARDCEPGKILHEIRSGEMAALGEIPFGRYYGSVDATPLYVILAGQYFERTGDLEFIQTIWPSIERALEWIDLYGDIDNDGFVEYIAKTPSGLAQQGWKDSHDAIFHENGEIAVTPIALCEVQGYVYQAKNMGAKLAALLGFAGLSFQLHRSAETLKELFNQTFWDDQLESFIVALDCDKRPCRIIGSNMGQCLCTGIVGQERSARVAQLLLSPELFSGWGVRTLAAGQVRYNPISYHNGSVWPHDNALIALGLARYGFKQEVVSIFQGLFDAAIETPFHRLPELFCGFHRGESLTPTQYPVACSPQAWAAGSVFSLLQSLLGLQIDTPNKIIKFNLPILPPSLRHLSIAGLKVGKASVDLHFVRTKQDVSVQVENRSEAVTVLVEK